MKTRKLLTAVIAFLAFALTTLAQTVPLTNVQTLCTKSIQPYNVNVGDATHDGSTYAWSIAPATPSAVITGNGTNAITIDWTNAPSGTYTLKAIETSTDGCVSTAVSASINLYGTPIAPVAPATQTFCTVATVANLVATGTAIKWYTATTGGTALNASTALITGNYYVSQTAGSCESNRTVVAVSVNANVAPIFTQVAPICSGGIVASLPTTSNNGITGNWTPAINNTKTTLYTFTPTAGQCASTTTQTITITTPKVTSAISFVAPVQNLSVGMTYGGGKIIYIFQPGDAGYVSGQTHGLIIAIGAITTTASGFSFGPYMSTYGCSGVLIGKTATAMGTGISNTNLLVASCGAGTVASICDSLVENGYSDWFLPSKDELSKVYQNYSLVGGVYPTQSQGVWSSSEVNANSGYVCSFDGGGGWVVLPKTYVFGVKPLRKF